MDADVCLTLVRCIDRFPKVSQNQPSIIYIHPQITTDLSAAFDWNIKQLFVFLVVEYQSKKNVRRHLLANAHAYAHPAPAAQPTRTDPENTHTHTKQVLSQVVVWDRIVERKEDAVLDMEAEFLDYPLRDPAMELRCVRGLAGCLFETGWM